MAGRNPNQDNIITLNLVNKNIIIDGSWGIKAFSVTNDKDSTSNGIINGMTNIASLTSENIQIKPGDSRSITPVNQIIAGVKIESPDNNCALEVIFIV